MRAEPAGALYRIANRNNMRSEASFGSGLEVQTVKTTRFRNLGPLCRNDPLGLTCFVSVLFSPPRTSLGQRYGSYILNGMSFAPPPLSPAANEAYFSHLSWTHVMFEMKINK
ncbi:hypothetical protein ACFX11_038604 [Malus domestica]